jgi:thioredoxin 1
MLCNRTLCFYLVFPALFILSGCWDNQKNDYDRERERKEEMPAPKREPEQAARDAIIHVESEEDFNKALKEGKPIIAKFWAEWCGPCQRMKPIFEAVANKHSDKVVFVSVNEKYKDKHNLLSKYNITGFPTFVFIDAQGNLKDTHVGGYSNEAALERVVLDFSEARRP